MKRRARYPKQPVVRLDLKLDDLKGIVERAKTAPLSEADLAALGAAMDTLAFLTQELAAKGASIERLRRLIFGGHNTEKISKIFGKQPADEGGAAGAGANNAGGAGAKDTGDVGTRPKAPGHGRNGAAAYSGATRVKVPHTQLQRGDGCAGCQKGKIYPITLANERPYPEVWRRFAARRQGPPHSA